MDKEVLTQENALAVANNNSQELNTGLFEGDTSVRKMTSLDLTSEEDTDLLLSSMQKVDFKLNDVIDQEITCTGCYVVERPVESFNEETGDVIVRKKHVLMIFDAEGKSYVTGSNACYMSFSDIVSLKGLPTKENPLTLMPIKVDAKEKGHSYLKLKLVIKKEK